MVHSKLIEDPDGMVFEYLDEDEAEFLYEEVFVRRSYLRHGLVVGEGATVIDAGANIGLFSLQCLREAKAVQVYAFEPIPVIYGVLTRNLDNAVSFVKGGACPKPVSLRVALGAEQSEEEFTYFGGSPGESTRHTNERERQQHVLLSDADAMSWRRALSVTPNQAKDTITKDKDVMDTWTLPGDDSNQGHTRHGTCSAAEEATGGKVAADDNRPALPGTESHRLVNDTAPRQDPKSSSLSVVAGDAALKEGGDGGDKTRETGSSAEKAIVEDRESPGKGGRDRGESFVCSVVPLSLALDQLRLNTVDLIKVDVEGDELAVLRGIDNYDWPNIRQVVLEVHDIDGRLAATVDLLQSEPAAFDEVCWEAQSTGEAHGYVMVIPEALKMFLVFAKRRPKRFATESSARPMASEGGSRGGTSDAVRDGKAAESSRGLGQDDSSGISRGREKDRAGDGGVMPPRFCCCGSLGGSGRP